MEKLERLLGQGARGLDPDQVAALQLALGNAASVIGDQSGDSDWLRRATAAYHAVLKTWTRERVRLGWAMTQNNLGNALRALGKRESGTARLEEAVAAYRAALEVFREAHAEFYINGTEANLARAEALLAERHGSSAPD